MTVEGTNVGANLQKFSAPRRLNWRQQEILNNSRQQLLTPQQLGQAENSAVAQSAAQSNSTGLSWEETTNDRSRGLNIDQEGTSDFNLSAPEADIFAFSMAGPPVVSGDLKSVASLQQRREEILAKLPEDVASTLRDHGEAWVGRHGERNTLVGLAMTMFKRGSLRANGVSSSDIKEYENCSKEIAGAEARENVKKTVHTRELQRVLYNIPVNMRVA
ncbi:MAG: hypothetical protein KKB81_01770 [Candidatus Margulisbacteria bacterium]|nr:hypothetical protein [Candidatus Margulisiibacteriota bacterium]MBU1021644.1 hypothetical protein [Candidatus Margulisiibacteriota bacterium]MBU1728794.1 hypothetical protein [Candidatus Margulisiibacteriota bacterium]MBU1955760.1 hypothetical protein [Candidatus Margulisiibacteriota bacterium]